MEEGTSTAEERGTESRAHRKQEADLGPRCQQEALILPGAEPQSPRLPVGSPQRHVPG